MVYSFLLSSIPQCRRREGRVALTQADFCRSQFRGGVRRIVENGQDGTAASNSRRLDVLPGTQVPCRAFRNTVEFMMGT